MTRTVLTLGCAAVLCLAYPEVRAAAQGGANATGNQARGAGGQAHDRRRGHQARGRGPGSAARNA